MREGNYKWISTCRDHSDPVSLTTDMVTEQEASEKKSLEDVEREYLEYYHNGQNQKDNVATKPPLGKEVRVPTVWAIEVYPPTFIENLWSGLYNLGVLNSKGATAVGDFLQGLPGTVYIIHAS
jgi:hypothetical protein